MSNSFGQAFRYFRASGGARTPGRIIAAAVFAAVAVGITAFLPDFAPSLANILPSGLFNGLAGTAYTYTIITMVCLLLYRIFATKLLTYGDVTDGHCFFAVGNGARSSSILAAKYCSGLFSTAATFVLGALFVFAASYALGQDHEDIGAAVKVMVCGLCALIIVHALQLIIGAVGGNRLIVGLTGFAAVLLGLAYLYIKKFFDPGSGAVDELCSFGLSGLIIPAVVMAAAAAAVCLTAPKSKLMRYSVEDLDSDMLRQLQFQTDLEVYEKMDEEYELLFAGKDVLDK